MTDHTQPQAVRVKPLVWVQNSRHKNSLWTGELAFETYYAIEPCGKVFRLMRGVFISEDGEDMPLEPTMETAKAAAQADYDARIMAAIEPAPDPRDEVIAQLVGAAEEMAAGVIVECDFDGDHSPDFGRRYVELRAALAAAKAVMP